MTITRWILLCLVLVAVGVGSLFTVQNMSRTVQVSLDLYVTMLQLARPAPLPAVLGVTLGVGWALGLVTLLPFALRRRASAAAELSGGDRWT